MPAIAQFWNSGFWKCFQSGQTIWLGLAMLRPVVRVILNWKLKVSLENESQRQSLIWAHTAVNCLLKLLHTNLSNFNDWIRLFEARGLNENLSLHFKSRGTKRSFHSWLNLCEVCGVNKTWLIWMLPKTIAQLFKVSSAYYRKCSLVKIRSLR